MCGILGAKGFSLDTEQFAALNSLMTHRGPDFSRVERPGPDLLFGHNRLAIVGLEQESNQPFTSGCGRYTIVYNGEIYNYVELRVELAGRGVAFRTTSDTEVLLECWIQWGALALQRLNGMFAFAIYDRQTDRLVLARDRLGVKPLYYSWDGQRFAFASELQPLASLLHSTDLDAVAADAYCMLGYVPGSKTIYRSISKLRPAHVLEVANGRVVSTRYWAPCYEPGEIPLNRAVDELDELLADAVRLRMRADVPVGAFLSGGIDSALVVAYMRRHGGDISTFTIGFDDPKHDERLGAARVASRLNTRHRVEKLDRSALQHSRTILAAFGEPFADSSAIPTYFVSKLAASQVKVVLSGDGGDEAFMGYDRHKSFRFMSAFGKLPPPIRASVRTMVGGVGRAFPRVSTPRRLCRVLQHEVEDDVRYELRRRTRMPHDRRRMLHGFDVDATEWLASEFCFTDLTPQQRAVAIDVAMSLPDDMLVKVDRMSMANSLEVRSPFLDYRVMEYALRLPLRVKLRGFTTKYILRVLVARYLGGAFARPPKRGFASPLSWMDVVDAPSDKTLSSDERYVCHAYSLFLNNHV